MRKFSIVTAALVGAAVAGCAGHIQPNASGDAYLSVDNRTVTDYTVYLLPEGGVRERIGDVLSLHKSVIPVSTAFVGPGMVQFIGLPKLNGPLAQSEPMHVAAGDTVSLTIAQ